MTFLLGNNATSGAKSVQGTKTTDSYYFRFQTVKKVLL